MTVILARLRTGSQAQRVVHAWYANQAASSVVRALCGSTAQADELERCGQSGMPCEDCTMLAAAMANNEHTPPPRPERAPTVPYAVDDLEDPTICHVVPDLPIVGSVNGRPVVVAACGETAWLKSGTPTGQRCPDCGQQQDVAQLEAGRADQ